MPILIFSIAIVVGVLGSMLGIGGGVIIIPIMTIFLGIPIKVAMAASLISVVATSTVAGAAYGAHGLTHNRLGMLLEVTTALGALAGGLTAAFLPPRALQFLFTFVILYVVYSLGRLPKSDTGQGPTGVLDATYVDPISGQLVVYGVHRLPTGLGVSFLAGNVSGLLGIGGGIIKVPLMALVLGLPLRAAIATSNFTIGVTAATSALIYYGQGYIDPEVVIPSALGVILGARFGPLIGRRLQGTTLKRVFQSLLVVLALQMLIKAVMG